MATTVQKSLHRRGLSLAKVLRIFSKLYIFGLSAVSSQWLKLQASNLAQLFTRSVLARKLTFIPNRGVAWVTFTFKFSSSLSLSRRGPLRRSRMTSSDSISPHVSRWTVVVANLVQPSLVGATWTTLPRRVRYSAEWQLNLTVCELEQCVASWQCVRK